MPAFLDSAISSDRKRAVEQAIAYGLEYILDRQSKSGSWTEWALPPGKSAPWTTAYIGYRLRLLPPCLSARAVAASHAAAAWLLEAEFPGGGWGYNEAVEVDADSTAYGILFLSSADHAIPESSYQRLKQFQRSDGGFSTYIGDESTDSWAVSHPDVSSIATLALLTKYARTNEAVDRGAEYVLAECTPSGLWNSFWWESPLYSTEACLSLVREANARIDMAKTGESLLRIEPGNAFEAALLVSSLLSTCPDGTPPDVLALVDSLLQEQRSDGTWTSEPILRVTRRDCFEPWSCPEAGPLFPDPGRLFTSSTVLETLSKVCARM
jgi:uncharacterized protein YfaS (alpha-2-macroglobulin family)